AGPVTKLMEQGPVIVDLLEESGLRRDVDGIVRRKIERLRAADADIRTGCRGERLGLRHDLALRQGRRLNETMPRQVIALIDVEDGVAAQEGNSRLLVFRFVL